MAFGLSQYQNKPWFNLRNVAIFIVVLFQVSAVIGIGTGHASWFLSKTPLNLIILGVLTVLVFPIKNSSSILGFLIFFLAGMVVEWVGVHYDFLFGPYYYGENLGWKLDGVPYLIGLNWATLILICGAIAQKVFQSDFLIILFGALLMVVLDYFIEQQAAAFDFWYFENNIASLQNYVAWYVISAILLVIYRWLNIQGDFIFSLVIYLIQFLFFAYFNIV